MTWRNWLAVVGLAFVVCEPGWAQGQNLLGAVEAALRNDLVLLALRAQTRATAEAVPRARADLLPRLSFQASESKNTSAQYASLPGSGNSPTVRNDYDSKTRSLSLSQPIFRPRAWLNYLQGEASVAAAEADLASGEQQAIDRVVAAFAEKFRLEAGLFAATADERAKDRRLALLNGLARAEQAGAVDVKRAEAELSQIRARVEETAADLGAANRELARLTAGDWSIPITIAGDGRALAGKIIALLKQKLAAIEEQDIENHPAVVASRLRYEAARRETGKRQSDHLPTLDFVAGINEGNSASDVTIGRYSKTRSVGLQLNVPLYSGGAVSSSVREALALAEKAELELRNLRLSVQNDRARTSAQLRSSMTRLEADAAALDAAELDRRRADRGRSSGITSDVDLLTAEARKADSLSGLVASAAKAIATYSKFMLAQGGLEGSDLADLSRVIAEAAGSGGGS